MPDAMVGAHDHNRFLSGQRQRPLQARRAAERLQHGEGCRAALQVIKYRC